MRPDTGCLGCGTADVIEAMDVRSAMQHTLLQEVFVRAHM